MRVACLLFVILAISIGCGEAAKKRKKFEGDFEFADDVVIKQLHLIIAKHFIQKTA